MISKILKIFFNAVPIMLMIGLIPFVSDDFMLTAIYCGIIGLALGFKYEKRDYVFLIFGFVIITVSELFFVATGAEVFTRASLFGLIPLWLPFLWAYAFVAIKRSIVVLNRDS